jgi:hypothetical protein
MPRQYFKEQSKEDWYVNSEQFLSEERLKLGAILRIADATEVMARNYQALVDERNMYKHQWAVAESQKGRLKSANAALRDVIKKLKKPK